MSNARRIVRVTERFFSDLDRQLMAERGPGGEPSVNDFNDFNDFNVFELLEIVETFATRFDDLPRPIANRDDYRILIASGVLVPRYSVIGQTADDGAI